jgi:hypothetical protein
MVLANSITLHISLFVVVGLFLLWKAIRDNNLQRDGSSSGDDGDERRRENLKANFSSFFTSIHPIRGRGEIGTFVIAIFVHVCLVFPSSKGEKVCFVFAKKSTAYKPNRKMPS